MAHCTEDIDIDYVLATEDNNFVVLEDGDTLILLWEEEKERATCTKNVWLTVEEVN